MPYALDNDVFFAALYEGHVAHIDARGWLDANKSMGWAIAMETYLAAMRLLMNPTILGRGILDGALARRAVETELAGAHPGRVLFSGERPKGEMFDRATGHRQVMDFWLIQTARAHGHTLVTRDKALSRAWPDDSMLLP
ncbi:MAG TPA: PIN domain-containing protein [Opitutales bacterium]|nr:PIN domain-containing protein [Opitutales bacterium]